ncbi:hypothetical protein CWN83_21310 [Vibrio splendidus]|nr:hypothetical protein [Vibrio splendidus]PTP43611.1 hypothetical protein CWN83_21310 [Vibrio splendidus]
MSRENSDKPLLEVKNLCVDYITDDGDFNAVKSVSFSIGQGEIMRHGQIVEINQAYEIRNNPQHSYTQKLWSSFPNIHEHAHATTC